MWAKHQHKGFTIVELLIVIVVIAILAAITIVAYNGIQSRAKGSVASAALNQANKKILIAMNDGTLSGYPANQTAFNSLGLDTSNVSYQYFLLNGGTGYCITATVGSTMYKIMNDTQSSPGGCTLTNIVLNPSIEANVTNWPANWATGGAGTIAKMNDGGVSGSSYVRGTWSTAPTAGEGGLFYNHPNTGQITEGTTYTASVSVRTSKTQRMRASIYWINSSGSAISSISGTQTVLSPNTWTRLSVTSVAPAGTVRYFIVPFSTAGTGYSQWAVGDVVDCDAAMFTEGSVLYSYADGNSTDWTWTGAVNASSSTGPPQ